MDFLTPEKLQAILKTNPNACDWYEPLVNNLESYEIDSPNRAAAFLAQTSHESGDYRILSENLNYSQQGLRKVFPKYFPDDATAFRYARQPQAIANRVYGGRMGNGSEQSGDGWNYRGRGVLQVTGKNNYASCSQFLFQDLRLLDDPDYLTTMDGALQSAIWFWTANKLNPIADKGDVINLTKRINGGTIGLAERIEKYNRILDILTQ